MTRRLLDFPSRRITSILKAVETEMVSVRTSLQNSPYIYTEHKCINVSGNVNAQCMDTEMLLEPKLQPSSYSVWYAWPWQKRPQYRQSLQKKWNVRHGVMWPSDETHTVPIPLQGRLVVILTHHLHAISHGSHHRRTRRVHDVDLSCKYKASLIKTKQQLRLFLLQVQSERTSLENNSSSSGKLIFFFVLMSLW